MAKAYDKTKPPKGPFPKTSRIDPKFADLLRGKSPNGSFVRNPKSKK